jgi:ABC-type transport system involved in multi-copper enzyme maturation permease subunit
MSPILQFALVGTVLCLVQVVAALPWLAALDPKSFKAYFRRPTNWLAGAAGIVIAGGVLGFFISMLQDPYRLVGWGRVFGAVLQVQLLLDFFVLFFPLVMMLWPQGASVAFAAFREGVRQPMFWLIFSIGVGLMVISPFLPYYTFGEDLKTVMQLGSDTIMLLTVLFSVLAASMSISEEIEGRSAITVMSKPVSRRQFLLGKFLGTLMAALLLQAMLGIIFTGVLWFKPWFDNEAPELPTWLPAARASLGPWMGDAPVSFVLGMGVWLQSALVLWPVLLAGFCHVTVLLAIAVALATRLPMIVNLVTCLVIFFLGHLAPVLVEKSAGRFQLINFMAKFFNNVLPGLDYFDMAPIIVRDVPPDLGGFAIYMGSVFLYAILYSVIALLFGLILFEDRDLA